MRYRLMASFQGASYQAGVGPTDEQVTLFAACPPPEEHGFRSSSNHWRKTVSVADIDALWESRPIGRYRGERCMVLDDLGERMHIAYLGRDLYLARRLGFWEVDRGVFEVVVPRQDIDDLREERGEYELAVVNPVGRGSGGWDGGSLPTWSHNPRDQRQPAPDTGPLRAVGANGLIDTGPSWAADPRLTGRPGAPTAPMTSGWNPRDEHTEDPRDTGTWAAIGDPQDAPETGGPFPRARGGWQARDTGGWQAPDTGAWDPREVERLAARERAAANGWNGQTGPPSQNGQAIGWNGQNGQPGQNGPGSQNGQAGAWNDRVPDRRGTPPGNGAADQGRWGTPGWEASRSAASWGQDSARPGPGPSSGSASGPDTGSWNAHDVTDPGLGTGAWPSPDVTATDPGRWDPQDDTMSWSPVTSGEWDHDEPAWGSRGAHGTPGGQGSADWNSGELVQPGYPPPTQDAAAVWHGSPFPENNGRWSRPGPAGDPATSGPGPRYDDPPLARQAAAITGAYAAPTTGDVAASAAPERGGFSDSSLPGSAAGLTPGPAAGSATGSRYVGRRSARKPRVTTQAIFSQLLDLAAIPQSSYAVDNEVDGAMCLIRARGGYEVFSAVDQSRHEVRFFEDEEAAYFYLFGVLAADAIRNGQLGPKGS